MAEIQVTPSKAVSILRSAIVNARIYPKGSQMIESTLRGAHQALQTCLAGGKTMVVSDIQGKLCIDGKEASDARDFRPFLAQHEVQNLKFTQGVQVAELSSLIEGLGKRKGQYGEQKTLAEWLKAQNATHIEVEEVQFVALQKGEVVVQQVTQLLEQSSGDTTSLIGSLEESVKMMGQLPEESVRKEVKQAMARHLASLPPQQIREVFESKLSDNVEKMGLREDVVQALSREKLEETLEEVNKWYHQVKKESKSEFDVVEKLSGLKSFLGKVLHSPASKMVSFALYEELLKVELIDEIPAGVQKGEHSSLVAQVEHLLGLPSASLLDPPVRQGFPELLRGLCGMGLEEELQKLTDKVMENLNSPTPLIRETTVKTLRLFEETFAANRKEKHFLNVTAALHKASETESAPDVYGEMAMALQVAAMELLVNWKFEESALLLSTLRRHHREESPVGQKKKQLAAKALREFSSRGLEVICADLNAPLKDRQNGAYRVLAELGEEAVGPLVEAVKRSIDQRSRQAAFQALKRLGPVVKEPLLKQMTVQIPADVLVKLIPLLEDMVDAGSLATFQALLQHPDGPVRRQVAQLLVKMKEPQAQALLIMLLDDADPDVSSDVVRWIAETRMIPMIPEILKRLSTASPMTQEEMCITLGTFKDRRAIPFLLKLLQNNGSFWRKTSGTPDNVKMRAIWALGQLMPSPEAEAALQRALKDSNPMIQRSAQNALHKAIPSTTAA